MTKRRSAPPAPAPLEAYCQQFDPLFGKLNQREAFRSYLAGLLLPAERNKTLTALANTEPGVGAQRSSAQKLQWFLSESTWDWRAVNEQRVALLRADALTAPNDRGVLVIDESGDRKWGAKTAHVGRQYLANLGKIDSGVVSVTSLWADERMCWPVDFEPYTPAHWFERSRSDPQFRTKLTIGAELVGRAIERGLPFRAVVADSFYGEDLGFQRALDAYDVGYVLALKPSHAWWHPIDEIGSLWEGAQVAGWESSERTGAWEKVPRQFRDGHTEDWWALEAAYGPYGPDQRLRAVVVTTDPAELPELTTWYLLTNLPAPGAARAQASTREPADLAEISRLYGLRAWVEQSYKQTKHALGWSHYQVRSDLAIRRHWELVCCAFSFCWHHQSQAAAATTAVVGRGKNRRGVVATGPESGQGLAGAVDPAGALLDRVVAVPPTAPATGIA